MNDLRKAAQQALGAFTGLLTFNPTYDDYENGRVAVDALRAALAQPERKPLTEEEIVAVLVESAGMTVKANAVDLRFARAVENAHGIGND